MTHDEFARYARFPTGDSLRLDEVVVRAHGKIFNMTGSLRIVEEEFVLDLVQCESKRIGRFRSFFQRILGRPEVKGSEELPQSMASSALHNSGM